MAAYYITSDILHVSKNEAIDCLKADEVVCDCLGEHVLTKYVEGKEKEWDAYRTHVSQWEKDRYLVMY